jgi:hypothetical protein
MSEKAESDKKRKRDSTDDVPEIGVAESRVADYGVRNAPTLSSAETSSHTAPNGHQSHDEVKLDLAVIQSSSCYETLDGQSEIRLVRVLPGEVSATIECELDRVEMDEAHKHCYKALSYTWGSPSATRVITLDGEDFKVTQNLWSALHHLRSPEVVQSFWIDAICINQSNIHERNTQVKKMGTIYQRAEEVIAWLGCEDDNSSTAFTLMKTIVESDDASGSKHNVLEMNPFSARAWNGLIALSCREYWSRVWIIQEVLCATKLRIQCGYDQVPWSTLTDFRLKCASSSLSQSIKIRYSEFLRSPAVKIDEQCGSRASGHSLLTLLEASKSSRSSEPRDRVFALIGLAKDRFSLESAKNQLNIDYKKSTFELYDQIVRLHSANDRVHVCQLLRCLFLPPNTSSVKRIPGFIHRDVDKTPIDAIGHKIAIVEQISPPSTDAIGDWMAVRIDMSRDSINPMRKALSDVYTRKLASLDLVLSPKREMLVRDSETEYFHLTVQEENPSKEKKGGIQPLEGGSVSKFAQPRVFFTRNGYVGLAPYSTKAGDEIYQFEGSNVALIISQDWSSGSHIIVGRAFLIRPDQEENWQTSLARNRMEALEHSLFCPTSEQLIGDALAFSLRASSWELLT